MRLIHFVNGGDLCAIYEGGRLVAQGTPAEIGDQRTLRALGFKVVGHAADMRWLDARGSATRRVSFPKSWRAVRVS